MLELEKDENWEWYSKNYVTDAVREDITKRLKEEYSSEVKFYEKLEEAYVLSVVKKPDGVNNMREVLSHFYKEIGIDKQYGKDTTYRALAGKNFTSYESLRNEFSRLEQQKESNINSGGSSGGSGGGSAESARGSKMLPFENITYPQSMTNKPIQNDIFVDLEDFKWAKQAIIYLAEKRIVTGKTNEEFYPADYVTREEFAAMLVRAFADSAETVNISFTDTVSGAWYEDSLKKAVNAGIVEGYDDGRFGIGDYITRQDMTVMLKRAAEYAGMSFEVVDNIIFADADEISEYAKPAVSAMKNVGVINGVTPDTFEPRSNANRAQAAKVIFELLNL